MPDAIERAARAIAGQLASYPYDKLTKRGRQHCRDAAREAFRTLRDPTDAMLAPAMEHLDTLVLWGDAGGPAPLEDYRADTVAIWQAMIDALLEEGK